MFRYIIFPYKRSTFFNRSSLNQGEAIPIQIVSHQEKNHEQNQAGNENNSILSTSTSTTSSSIPITTTAAVTAPTPDTSQTTTPIKNKEKERYGAFANYLDVTISTETEDMIRDFHSDDEKKQTKKEQAKKDLQLLMSDIDKLLDNNLKNVSDQNQTLMQQIASCIEQPKKVITELTDNELDAVREMAKKILDQYVAAIQLIILNQETSLKEAFISPYISNMQGLRAQIKALTNHLKNNGLFAQSKSINTSQTVEENNQRISLC